MFAFTKQFSLAIFAIISIVNAGPIAEVIDNYGNHGERHSEAFGLVAINSGSSLHYQHAVVSHGELFLNGNSSDPYSFNGVLFWDGSLQVIPDDSRFEPESVNDGLFLSVAENSTSFITSPKRDTSFAVKGGHLTYKGSDGVFAIPDHRYGYQYSLKSESSNSNAVGLALRATTKSGGVVGDYPA